MAESIILFTVIASTILNPFLNYLVNSRCSKIKCCCLECDREVFAEIQDLEENKKKKNNNVNNQM
tara:strand:- start:67 stop:261 length:195 start_codon:yes stop_codon:yes gene_type:complete